MNHMRPILIRQVLAAGKKTDILIEGNRISCMRPSIEAPNAEIIDGRGLIAVPGMANLHTHAAMTLFRGYGDDLPLFDWLNNYIWPVEAHLTDRDYLFPRYVLIPISHCPSSRG